MRTTTTPAKDWNAMSGKMEDTSLPHWQKYYQEIAEFEARMYAKEPRLEDFETEADYRRAKSEWDMAFHCDAPNKPGYYRANND